MLAPSPERAPTLLLQGSGLLAADKDAGGRNRLPWGAWEPLHLKAHERN